MSSRSPKISDRNEILIIGDSWKSLVFAHSLLENGYRPNVVYVPQPVPSLSAIHVGNGEMVESAHRIFGVKLASVIWELSSKNYERAKKWFQSQGVVFQEDGILWFGLSQKEEELFSESKKRLKSAELVLTGEILQHRHRKFRVLLSEGALAFDVTELQELLLDRLKRKLGSCFRQGESVTSIERRSLFQYRTLYEVAGHQEAVDASVAIVVSDYFASTLFPTLSDKLISVTLSSFTFQRAETPEFSMAVFNGGADFAIQLENTLRLGSFRNLFEDKAVGIKTAADAATYRGVTSYFSEMGWIKDLAKGEPHLTVESLSCDGLPIVGALPDFPGVYVIGGFAARTQNFIFEISHQLVGGILGLNDFAGLAPFSTKRFI